MSDKISHGFLPVIPADIFFAKQKLIRKLKREPTGEELAEKMKITLKELNDKLNMKTEYNENSLSPSFESGADVYYGSPLQKNTRKVPLFENPNRYDGGGGGKGRQRKYKKRTHTKKYKNSKTRRKSMTKSMTKSMKKYV